MKILFAGNFWLGSDARSFKDALNRRDEVHLDEIDFDRYVPGPRSLGLRLGYRLLRPLQVRELFDQIRRRARALEPDAIVTFKGSPLTAAFIQELQTEIAPVICIYPDKSPKEFGPRIAEAMGAYELVLSTKLWHPQIWATEYGYTNRCIHLSHGYDPRVHYRAVPATDPDHDIVMIAKWRPLYDRMVKRLMDRLGGQGLIVALGGPEWQNWKHGLPEGWSLIGVHEGNAYTEWMRRGRIVIAPVETEFQVDGHDVHADEVTSRTFQCPAANVFFLHPRTSEAQALFDEQSEVPMFADADDLADKIEHYLAHPEERHAMAAAAHARAVPAYSHDARAGEIVAHLKDLLDRRDG